MNIQEINWAEQFKLRHRNFDKDTPGSEESRATWDAKAASFAHKRTRSDYINQLIKIMALEPEDTIFDMGCGSGTLAIPLAEAGHNVIAVDFSNAMLEELKCAAKERDVLEKITTFQRSWQEDWSGLPKADVAISSRSFVTDDLEDGIAKLEGQAKRRVFLSCGAGDLPYRDSRIFEAMGRPEDAFMPPVELAIITNYLWMTGRLPTIHYIEYPARWKKSSREALVEAILQAHSPKSDAEETALNTFLDEHIVFDMESSQWMLDYLRHDRWAVIEWTPLNL